ncbi:hypothetical protein [Polyangium spumosum]|uniref:TIGR02646 family protein n=1 Tax=Polyangium spumosum TaxID=889282 RepID=A0A6N7Q360_9BACT|nr:hypothetical protein [Polyangium spumosum]MRG98469.1 hypothetical protein [Polyangium spumosum]
MIPVQPRGQPKGFNQKVYRPGVKWLRNNNLPRRGAVPKGADGKNVELHPYWRHCLDDLYRRYRGVCAYAAMHIPRTTGARSTDHFIAKSSAIEHAYRWRNLRLACTKVNARKGAFDELLDPFEIAPDTFHLNLFTGSIFPNPALAADLKHRAQTTIERLGLDDEDCRKDRRDYFDDYRMGETSEAYLKKRCPFVWYEVHRQKLKR